MSWDEVEGDIGVDQNYPSDEEIRRQKEEREKQRKKDAFYFGLQKVEDEIRKVWRAWA